MPDGVRHVSECVRCNKMYPVFAFATDRNGDDLCIYCLMTGGI